MTTDSMSAPAPDETREQQDKRLRARTTVRPDGRDPLAGLVVIAHQTVRQEHDSRGHRLTRPTTTSYEVLADKCGGVHPVAYRHVDSGAIEWIGGSSTSHDTVERVELSPRSRASDRAPGAKPSSTVLQRFSVPPERKTVYDEDGTEREIVGRAPRCY